MSVTCNYEEGTSLVLDEEVIEAQPGFIVTGTLTRLGNLCILAVKVVNLARAAWNAETTYSKGELATEGGTYVSLIAENTGHKPSSSPAQWQAIPQPSTCLHLPAEFGPGGNNHVEATYSLAERTTKRLQAIYSPSETAFLDPTGNFDFFD